MLIVGSETIKCQHCGHVIKIASKDSVKTYSTNTQESKTNIKHKPKTSILSILSLIFFNFGNYLLARNYFVDYRLM